MLGRSTARPNAQPRHAASGRSRSDLVKPHSSKALRIRTCPLRTRGRGNGVRRPDRIPVHHDKPGLLRKVKAMKHLLSGVAVVAALAFSAPVWAQPTSPSGGNAVGLPGPNPGGPGLTPYSGGAPTYPAAPPPTASPPSGAPPASTYESTSATPPSYHRHARHGYKKTVTYRRGGKKGYPVTGGNADQLNQEELARLQAGNYSNPSAPSYNPPPSGPGYSSPPSHPPMGTTGGGAPYRP